MVCKATGSEVKEELVLVFGVSGVPEAALEVRACLLRLLVIAIEGDVLVKL